MNIRSLLKVLLPLIILAAAVLITVRLIAARPKPEPVLREIPAALVETMTAAIEDRTAIIRATGTAQPTRESSIVPQVAGKIVRTAENFKAGGFFRKGELMLTIEDTDYRLAIERAEADVVRAEVELAKVEGAARVAGEEWESFGREGHEESFEPSPLVFYEPQLRQARSAVRSAGAARDLAALNLDRTRITAPYNCRVRSENVAVGQFVHSGAPVAVIADTDSVEIFLPVKIEDLEWLEVPGAKASIRMPGSSETLRTGRVIRSLGEIDPKTRMATLVVSVADPYGLSRPTGEREKNPTLPMGLFVEVDLEGRVLPEVISIPRRALRENSTVWVAENGALRIREVRVTRAQGDESFITAGIEPGAQIILTTLTGVGEGMAVRTTSEARP